MLLALAVAAAAPISPVPPAPDGDRWAWVRTVHTIADAQTCKPNGTFAISLRWRLHHGVERVVIKRHGKMLPSTETDKIEAALKRATDVGYVQLSCANTRDAFARIAYVEARGGRGAEMVLSFTIRPSGIDLFPRSERAWGG